MLPAIDLTASSTPAKLHPGTPVISLPFPPFAPAGGPCSPAAGSPESLGGLLALLHGVTRIDWSGSGSARAARFRRAAAPIPARSMRPPRSGSATTCPRSTPWNCSPRPTCGRRSAPRWGRPARRTSCC
ncbi:hypothetical protein GXW82_15425 [Streptacidiphilus sp. 4-A2]|nr:hypothetical protein [Streptacidiphilus sp. 4-A2]